MKSQNRGSEVESEQSLNHVTDRQHPYVYSDGLMGSSGGGGLEPLPAEALSQTVDPHPVHHGKVFMLPFHLILCLGGGGGSSSNTLFGHQDGRTRARSQGHCDFTKHNLGQNSRIYALIKTNERN